MLSELDAIRLLDGLPDGVAPDADVTPIVTGRLLGLDPASKLAQVSIGGSDGVWMPALPAIYTQDGAVRILRSAIAGGRASICLGPVNGASLIAAGKVTAVLASVGQLTVDTLGKSVNLPYLPGTYSAGTLVHVLRSSDRLGLPEIVLGPSGSYNHTNPGQPGGGSSGGGESVTRQATILPQWSGSWRSMYSRWDSWNTDRYGGRSTLWQGNDYGSGPMKGLAVYGDQIVNLGATEIISITASVYRADSSSSSAKVAVLQPSPHGSQPGGSPASSGATAASAGLTSGQGGGVALPGSVLDGFRTGAFKGLCTVGGDYLGINGTPDRAPVRADGMALNIVYRAAG